MLSEIIKIDGDKPLLASAPTTGATATSENPEEFKEGRVTDTSSLAFLMKENRIMSLDLMSQKLIEIETLKDTYMAKLLPTSNKSLLVVGGQTTKQRSAKQTQIKNNVTELYWNELTNEWRVSQKDFLKVPRISFGACFTRAKTHIVVTGGFTTDFKPTKKTEVYSINANAWS